jgi:tryptophan synthase alpha chain
MMPASRLEQTFARLHAQHRGGMVTYSTAGDPDADTSASILIALARAGADVLEVGVPFSDPLADGPVIQRATERALAAGMTLRGTLDVVRAVRRAVDTPIVLFTYANPVVRMDPAVFAREASDAGVDGVLILDYPVEEAEPLRAQLVAAGLDPIFLISPTTTDERICRSAELGRGFLYVISRLGVTGVRDALAADARGLIERVRAQSRLPVALGFGISSPAHVAQACASADAAVVGSALVQVIADHGREPDVAERAGEYVRWLKSAV